MKALITAAEIRKAAENHDNTLYVAEGSIITPAAQDAAKEFGVDIIISPSPSLSQEDIANRLGPVKIPSSNLDPDLVSRIIAEVMTCLKQSKQPSQLLKEADPSGLRIVKGDSVVLEDFNTGNPNDHLQIKELFNKKECSAFSVGFMAVETKHYTTTNSNDEIDFIIEGTLECSVEGRKYSVQAGDILLIPAHTKITLTADQKVKLLYIA